jgi:zinc transport system permease protein
MEWLEQPIQEFSNLFPPGSFLWHMFMVKALLGILLVSLICGAVGSLVVSNRMAFFSDALAHTAFAGIAIGLLTGLAIGAVKDSMFYHQGIPFIMVALGIIVGLAIAFVRERTELASDTVIGVFFAWAMGFGALLLSTLGPRGYYKVENFLFGSPITISVLDLIILAVLAVLTLALLLFMYNQMVFTSFNPSLARSRNMSLRLCNYLFIILLAMIVNLCLKAVGALLINALLIVPAATAANLCRNMRQLFWTTMAISVTLSVLGLWLSFEVVIPMAGGDLTFGPGGAIVVLNVLLFFVSMLVAGPRRKGLFGAAAKPA